MPREYQYSSAEILTACREMAANGIDPSYRNFKKAGIAVCGKRLRHVRDAAIISGELVLPRGTNLCAVPVLVDADYEPETWEQAKVGIPIPKSRRRFIEIERRRAKLASDTRAFHCLKIKPTAAGTFVQWQLWFANPDGSKRWRRVKLPRRDKTK